MDAIGADFKRSVKMITQRLGANPVPIQIPMGSENKFEGVISLIEMKAIYNTGQNGEKIEVRDIPSIYLEDSKQQRKQLLESIAPFDDDLMINYLEDKEISTHQVISAIRSATLLVILFQFYVVQLIKYGIQMLLDSVVDFLPSPLDVPITKGHTPAGEVATRSPSDKSPFSALIF